MSPESGNKPFAAGGPNAASEVFRKYCEAEFERRANTGDDFDEAPYREAMEMVLKRLRHLEAEGLA